MYTMHLRKVNELCRYHLGIDYEVVRVYELRHKNKVVGAKFDLPSMKSLIEEIGND